MGDDFFFLNSQILNTFSCRKIWYSKQFNFFRCHRRFKAESDNAQGGGVHQTAETKRPRYIRVGNPRSAVVRRRLRQVQRTIRQLHKSNPAKQDRQFGAHVHAFAQPLQRDLSELFHQPPELSVDAGQSAGHHHPVTPSEAGRNAACAQRQPLQLAEFAQCTRHFGGCSGHRVPGHASGPNGTVAAA